MQSLDPRVNRLPQPQEGSFPKREFLDQLGTFETFVQPKAGKPFQHEGIVHASDVEMAYLLAKESLTRRFQCVSIFITDTRNISASAITEGDQNAYDLIPDGQPTEGATLQDFEVFHLLKRGKQHVHAGKVNATDARHAMAEAKKNWGATKVYNVWVVPASKIRFTSPEEADLWNTLPDKKFRDASDYKGGDILKNFLERQK